mmetsp:Transcript_6160/g.7543  ORF Transcript_6160/g.7543 Transcript_6160/m.7543 type:complete len:206 (-) Transcript_6160:47-664(-)
MKDHILLITDEFREQSEDMDDQDLTALYAVVSELPGVGFFNSGPIAGASQLHRHLQAVPLDTFTALSHNKGISPPMDELMHKYRDELLLSGRASRIKELSFKHALFMLPISPTPTSLLKAFKHMLKVADCDEEDCEFNLVMTSKWMFLVPRAQHIASTLHSGDLGINSLAFTGCLLVREGPTDREATTDSLPIPSQILEAVTFPI